MIHTESHLVRAKTASSHLWKSHLWKPVAGAWLCLLACALVLTTPVVGNELQGSKHETSLPDFFQAHCVRCHSESNSEGEFRIDDIPLSLEDPAFGPRWSRAYERINSGEMPPPEEEQPSASERYMATEWIAHSLHSWDSIQNSKQERLSFKRLTRTEYVNTLEDLLGYRYHPTDPGGLPEDPNWMGIERMGTVLSLTPSHIERYIAAAESALNAVVPLTDQPNPWKWEWNAPEVINWNHYRHRLRTDPDTPKHRLLIGPGNNWRHYSGGLHQIRVPYSGAYRIQITGSGLRPEDGSVPHVMLYDATIDRILLEQDLDAPEDQPATIEATVWLPEGTHDLVLRNELPGRSPYDPDQRGGYVDLFTDLRSGRSPFLEKVTDDEFRPYVPLLILDRVKIEALIDPWPPTTQQALFATKGSEDLEHARNILTPFASRAFRRDVSEKEMERLLKIFEEARKAGLSFQHSIRETLLATLCSHEFLFLVEGSSDDLRNRLNDFELASRLSYFLWSTMPDEHLLALAREGKLREPDVLSAEFKRLISDPRAQRFAYDFGRQWLRLNDVGKFPPDKTLYPEYDEGLQRSIIEESQAYLARMIADNLPLKDLIASNWSMLNNRTASHYGVPGVADHHPRLVELGSEHHRGGLLTQAAILTLTSDGFRHRPVHRGVWISEVIFGITPPPPPPNAGTLMPSADQEQPKSLREQLESHRAVASCAACHAKIDPLGFAFEDYDAIGRLRDRKDGNINDSSGVLPDGRSFSGSHDFKQLVVEDIDKVALAFTEKLAYYALRRGLSFSEKQSLEQIVVEASEHGLHTQDLLQRFVLSDLFQTR